MKKTYRYGHRPVKRRRTIFAASFLVSVSVLGILGLIVYRDLSQNNTGEVIGQTQLIPQVLGESNKPKLIDEPLFSFELPEDWKETDRVNSSTEQSVAYQATLKNASNRFLKIYVDKIPPNIGVNRMLPVQIDGDGLSYGQISDDCDAFTGPGATATRSVGPIAAKWQNIDFICNAGSIANQVGTSSVEAVNTITIRGTDGTGHRYFFLYTDHNVKPDYNILYEAINTFRAK